MQQFRRKWLFGTLMGREIEREIRCHLPMTLPKSHFRQNLRTPNSNPLEEAMQDPLITDAAGLALYLRNVKRWGHNGYDWSADPPCHASSSGAASSFHFGDAAGGGVKVGCWAGCQGPGFVKRIEDALGIRLQINVDGKLTHQSRFPAWLHRSGSPGRLHPSRRSWTSRSCRQHRPPGR